MRLMIILLLSLVPLSALAAGADSRLSAEQKVALEALAPGVEVTPELLQLMEEITLSSERPVAERMRAIGKLAGLADLPMEERTPIRICIWDIAGRAGPIFQAAREQQAQAMEFGIRLEMIPYTNEGVMVEEFMAGHCEAALMSGLRARNFNTYTGTVDAIGAVPDIDHKRVLLEVLSHPSHAGKMAQGEYVVLGIFPAGAAHVFVRDREINSLAKAAGRRVAVLDYDPMQAKMIAGIGATPVSTDITRAPGMFNNGSVDVLAAPLVAYELLELYKGMTPDGGIIDYPLTYLSMQLIGRRSAFPQEIAQLIREATFEQFDEVLEFLDREMARVPERWMISIPEEDRQEYEVMMQDARASLREMDYYHGDMLSLQRRIRCRFQSDRPECSNSAE